jgi:hypothetical protein
MLLRNRKLLNLLRRGRHTVHGSQVLMTDDIVAHGGDTRGSPITLNLKKVNGTWLIDDVTGSPKG